MRDEYNLQSAIKTALLKQEYSDYCHLIKRQGEFIETASLIRNWIQGAFKVLYRNGGAEQQRKL